MWKIDGRDAFFAEQVGAREVTLLDILCTETFKEKLQNEPTKLRFVEGDLHDPAVRAIAGQHEVVWSSGVLYHVPNPLETIKCLAELATEFLIVQSYTIPEMPGIANACVFWPGLEETSRRPYAWAYDRQSGRSARVGLSTEFRPEGAYDNWWWGMSGSAISAMLEVAAGDVIESVGHDLFRQFVVRVRSSPNKA